MNADRRRSFIHWTYENIQELQHAPPYFVIDIRSAEEIGRRRMNTEITEHDEERRTAL